MTSVNKKYKVLVLEDDVDDVVLIGREISKSNIDCEIRYVSDQPAYEKVLAEFEPDVILSDYLLPSYNGLAALEKANISCPNAYFIFVTGAIGEELAAETILNGADGFILKKNLKKLSGLLRKLLQSENRSHTFDVNTTDAIKKYINKMNLNSEIVRRHCMEIRDMIDKQMRQLKF